jgi:hypothetical protein
VRVERRLRGKAARTFVSCLLTILFEIKLHNSIDVSKSVSVMVVRFVFNAADVVVFFEMK